LSTGQRVCKSAAQIQADQAAMAWQRRSREKGREADTTYGSLLFEAYGERLREAVELLFLNPSVPGPHRCALFALANFGGKGGIKALVTTALTHAIDGISQTHKHSALASSMGVALELELRGAGLARDRPGTLRLMNRRMKKATITTPRQLRALGQPVEPWSRSDRFEVGGLLVDLLQAIGLLVRTGDLVAASPEARAIIAAAPAPKGGVRRLPMLEPPQPWTGFWGGDRKPLVVRAPYLEHQPLALQMAVANQLQAQPMKVDAPMVRLVRTAWDQGLPLFPVQRDPLVAPPRPEEKVGKDGINAWRQQVVAAQRDRAENGGRRRRIEVGIRGLEALGQGPAWFSYEFDFRGRIYTANRAATHQGPDYSKACIGLRGDRCGEEGFEWLLWAAAGHWGMTRASHEERRRWGKQEIERLKAAAEDPLGQLGLWRDAKDPWQFLQVCVAVQAWLADPWQPIGCPVRMDQHASGFGITACLTRDAALAARCRVTGDSPVDLYGHLAEQVTARLRQDMDTGPEHHQRQALQWLQVGIDRALMKAPAMTTCYGAGFLSLADRLALDLEEHCPNLPPAQWEKRLIRPSQYLARHVMAVFEAELGSVLALRTWMRKATATVARHQQHVEWHAPSGMLLRLGREPDRVAIGRTAVSGKRRWVDAKASEVALGGVATARGSMANLIHSFDGSFCQAIVNKAGEQRYGIITNHDCFATTAANASWLAEELMQQSSELYWPDWLTQIQREIKARSGVGISKPPMVGTLDRDAIGQNPYSFC
jgi:DNA-directed RNA polymerase